MAKCGFEWLAPYLLPPPSTEVRSRKQICNEELHHEGDHRSLGNVTKENKGEYKGYTPPPTGRN